MGEFGLAPPADWKPWAYDLVRRGRQVQVVLDAHFLEALIRVEALGLAPAHPLLPRVARVEPPAPGAVYRLAMGARSGPRCLEIKLPDLTRVPRG
jgi:hypothetical protein